MCAQARNVSNTIQENRFGDANPVTDADVLTALSPLIQSVVMDAGPVVTEVQNAKVSVGTYSNLTGQTARCRSAQLRFPSNLCGGSGYVLCVEWNEPPVQLPAGQGALASSAVSAIINRSTGLTVQIVNSLRNLVIQITKRIFTRPNFQIPVQISKGSFSAVSKPDFSLQVFLKFIKFLFYQLVLVGRSISFNDFLNVICK